MSKKSDVLPALAVVVVVLLFVASIAFAVWAHFIAPCSDINWLPAKELPARCFTWVKP